MTIQSDIPSINIFLGLPAINIPILLECRNVKTSPAIRLPVRQKHCCYNQTEKNAPYHKIREKTCIFLVFLVPKVQQGLLAQILILTTHQNYGKL